jgi:shikimate kinase
MMPSPSNIFLIGMPGVGKSTLGRALARVSGRRFMDSDDEIVKRNGVEIATIFEIEGEVGFRQRESQVIADLVHESGIVLGTGGGAILRAENRAHFRKNGLVVYLRASVPTLLERTTRDVGKRKKRPLLATGDVEAKLTALMLVREPLYLDTAHLTVDVNNAPRGRAAQSLYDAIADYGVPMHAESLAADTTEIQVEQTAAHANTIAGSA